MDKKETIVYELKHHLPFTFTVSFIIGMIVAGIYLFDSSFIRLSGGFFDVLHPVHILFSASATSAIYYKYNKSLLNALFIGIFGAIFVGSISDVILPYVSGNLFF